MCNSTKHNKSTKVIIEEENRILRRICIYTRVGKIMNDYIRGNIKSVKEIE